MEKSVCKAQYQTGSGPVAILAISSFNKAGPGSFPMAIPLNIGFAIIDAEDYEKVICYKWTLSIEGRNLAYAKSSLKENGKRKSLSMHRLIMNPPKGLQIDHINGNGLDNRKANMRIVTASQNSCNRRAVKNKKGKCIYKGVNSHMGKWRAYIRISGKLHHLGYFDSQKEAARAYNEAALNYFGEFACTNEIRNERGGEASAKADS